MYSPTRLLITLIFAVFATELLIMSVLTMFAPFPRWLENTVDACLLVILLFPILYFSVFRPLKKLNTELEARTQEAEAANLAKSSFMANISHEIRTPLHVLIGLGQLLRRAPDHNAQLRRLDQICATSEHLLALVNDILDFSKIEAGKFVLDDDVFRLGTLIDQVLEVISPLAIEKDMTLATDISPGLINAMLRGDSLRLKQVLINLGGNAVKFSDHGTIRFGVSTVSEANNELRLRFSVHDNGIGIDPEDLARIFEPFEQIDASITREYGGTGLGLAISQRLVSMMGGTIRVDSHPGEGSTFRFDVVFSRGDSTQEVRNITATVSDFAGKQVLVVEDHPLSQEIIMEMLEDLGCVTDIAADGAEAVECARGRTYDIILMDMQMPKVDGLAATRAIRALPGMSDKPIIALTANAFAEDRQRCLDAGMNDHVSKPVTSAKLETVLSQWLPGLVVAGNRNTIGDSEMSLALADIPGLEVDSSWLRSAERLSDYYVLLDKFVSLHSQDMSQLRNCLSAGERLEAQDIAHKLKGISGLIGAYRVELLAADLVQALRNDSDQASIAALALACEGELARLKGAIRSLPS